MKVCYYLYTPLDSIEIKKIVKDKNEKYILYWRETVNVLEIDQPHYRDRRVERQRRWPEELFRRLATLFFSDFIPFSSNSSP